MARAAQKTISPASPRAAEILIDSEPQEAELSGLNLCLVKAMSLSRQEQTLGSTVRRPQEFGRRRLQLHGGFTLLELLLVLTIIVAISAIAVPRLGEVLDRQRLNGSVNDLRLKWDRARIEAMRTGQAQVFECQLETGKFTIKPLVLQADISNAGEGADVMLSGGQVVETQASGFFGASNLAEDSEAQELEANITFLSLNVAGDMRSYSLAQEAQTSGLGDVNTTTVSQQVIFYPDGSTSTAEVQLKNPRGDVRAVLIRGLTGHCRVVAISNVATVTKDN